MIMWQNPIDGGPPCRGSGAYGLRGLIRNARNTRKLQQRNSRWQQCQCHCRHCFELQRPKKNNTACLQSSHIISSSVLAAERGGHAGEELAIYIILKWFKTNEVSIQPSPAWDFWPLESSHFVSYFISYITVAYSVPFALDLFDCGFRVRISSRVRASISFVFLHIFPFPCRLKDRKLPPSRLPRWLSSSMLRLYYTGHGFESHATIIFYVLKVFCKVFCKLELGLGKWRWRVSSGQKSCASAGCIDTA